MKKGEHEMYPEPSVPFYCVLSVYIPLLLAAYLAVFLTLSAVVSTVRGIASVLRRLGRAARVRPAAPATT